MSDISLPVVIAAPTGLAAFNIGGTTIHRVLSLTVEHSKQADYTKLHQQQLTLLTSTLKGTKLLIVDEVSMISALTLLFIHMRLTEIMRAVNYLEVSVSGVSSLMTFFTCHLSRISCSLLLRSVPGSKTEIWNNSFIGHLSRISV